MLQAECWIWSPPPVCDQASLLQVSLSGSAPPEYDLELLVYFGEPTAVSAVVEKGDPGAAPGECSWGGNMEAPLGCRKHGVTERHGILRGEISLETGMGMGMGGVQMG